MKTKFEELYSKIKHTDIYQRENLKFWYLGDMKLEIFYFIELEEKQGRDYYIGKMNDRGYYESTLIPENNILVVTYNNDIIFDRRYSYQGKHNTDLPPEYDFYIPDECGRGNCRDMSCEWHYGVPQIRRLKT